MQKDPNKVKALEAAIAQIEKNYGQGSIMKLGDTRHMQVESVPTGSLSLDLALGVGGIPKGRIVEIYQAGADSYRGDLRSGVQW